MQHDITVPEEVGEAIEAVADEEGISVSEVYVRAANEYLQRLRKRRAAEELKRRAGTIEVHGDIQKALDDVREEGKGRV